ncbi:DNA mismatch repair protein Mlh3 [Mantella aurantiaca]
MIQVLPEDVRCRLRSGIAITSVSQCVEELLLNSADAEATCIAVRVDLEILRVQVVDNGRGLGAEDMERVGVRYFTSKCHSLKDLEDLRFYGFRGEAIASMADVCSVVEITSRHKATGQTSTKLFQNRKALPVQRAEVTRPSAGTTVTLYNLFHNLPVRRGRVDPVLELERIRQRVEAASLMKPAVSFSLKNDALRSVVLQLPKTRDARSRFRQIYGPARSQRLREVRQAQGRLAVGGFISCEGHYSKTMQFLYVNGRLVLRTRVHKLIDLLLRKESVICRAKAAGYHRTGAELHAIFVLDIRCPYEEYDVCFEPDKTLIEFQDWSAVLLCVEQAVRDFLKKENLYSEPCKEEAVELDQKRRVGELSPEGGSGLPASGGVSQSALGVSDPASLRSKSVHRGNVFSAHNSAVTDVKATSGETKSLSPAGIGSDRPNLCSDLHPADGPNLVTDQEELLEQQLGHHGVTGGFSRLDSSANAQELGTPCGSPAHHQTPPAPKTLSNESLNAAVETADRNGSKSPAPAMHAPGGDPGCKSAVTCRPCSLDSVRIAGNSKKKLYEMNPHCADRLSVFAERKGALEMSKPTSYKAASLAAEVSKRTRPLKLHLPGGLGSLDRFKRSHGKKVTAASGGLGTETVTTDASCAPLDRIQPETAEETMTVTSEVIASPPALSSCASLGEMEPGTTKPQSSLSTKLCQLKRDLDLASHPLEIRSGELQLKNGTGRSMAEPSQSTGPSGDIQVDANVNAGDLPCEPDKEEVEPQTGVHLEEKEAQNSSPEWLLHYEQSLGRNVFINPCTGLSSYSPPQADQTATCTKDLSTMSVTVVCENGFQYQCYPFRSELLEPFLPRTSGERSLPSQRGDGSLQTLYSKWKNPVFPRHPEVAVDISKDNSDSLAVKIHNILYPYRFTKEMILGMEVLQQVDNKFIACLVDTKTERNEKSGGNLLVLVDQHAAHERVRLEQLIADSYEPSSEDGGRRLKVSMVNPPLEMDVTEEQGRLLRIRAGALQRVGLSLSFPDSCSSRVLVSEIPQCFAEKKGHETQRRRAMVARKMVEEFLQEEVQQSPGSSLGSLPGTVLKVLASQACHGAVKFNDPLSVDECWHLMRCLAQCSLPFQCAHGRPAILPLADLLHLQPEDQDSPKPNLSRLRRHYKAWQLFGSGSSQRTEKPIKAENHPDTQQSQAEGEA